VGNPDASVRLVPQLTHIIAKCTHRRVEALLRLPENTGSYHRHHVSHSVKEKHKVSAAEKEPSVQAPAENCRSRPRQLR